MKTKEKENDKRWHGSEKKKTKETEDYEVTRKTFEAIKNPHGRPVIHLLSRTQNSKH